ncbi:MAG TPA: NAD(P)-dependent oxidoreductase [Solirubrobacteraceae bacterium]|nr:NAD(P)-dependent oxidoreductase [Solirubrobacteraceae bacterium]
MVPARSRDGVLDAVARADVILGDWTHELGVDAELLDRAGRCLAVLQPTAGTDGIDLEHAAALGIPVANAPGTNDRAVAEWVVMAILALLKDVWRHHAGVLAGRWDMLEADVYELGDRTVGILGFGRIGQAVAARLAPFELRRLVYADVVGAPASVEGRLGVQRVDVDELCAVSDALTVHVPLLESTVGLLDRRRIGLLPAGAVVINAARGPVIDEAALCDALDAGRVRGAALDVFSVEPLPMDSPLRGRPNVLLSPHLAGSTNEARGRMVTSALRNLDRVLRGGAPEHVVNGVTGVPRRPEHG